MNDQPPSPPTQLRELAALFTRLGFTAFGGPAAHVSLMEDEIVTRKKWLDRQHFLDLVSAVNFIPGPNSTELAIHVGQLRAGFAGLVVAGVCFIVPAVLIILPIAWVYVTWGSLPQVQPALRGIAAAVAGIVIFATWRFAQTAMRDAFALIVGIVAAAAALGAQRFPSVQPEIPILFLAAIAGIVRQNKPRNTMLAIALPIGFWPELLRLAMSMLKIGATLFGTGYVLVSYLQSDLVDHRHWLTQQQLADAIAVGQFTPGPLLTTATFVGYVLGHGKFGGGVGGGILAAATATIAIFLPAFVLIAIFGPMLQKLRKSPRARGALDAMNAAVVGLMAIVAVRLTMSLDELGWVIFAGVLAALWKRINATWLILAAGTIGAAVRFAWPA